MAFRVTATLLPIPIFVTVGLVLFAASATPEADATAGPDAGFLDRPLPGFILSSLNQDGAGLSDSSLSGRVSLLHVFASWCSTCRAEHPMLMQLAAGSGATIVGVNWKDRKGAALLYLGRNGNPYAATGADPDGVLGRKLGVTGVPETYLVDAEGRIRYRHVGPITKRSWERVLQPILADLEAKP